MAALVALITTVNLAHVSFERTNGANPEAGLTLGRDGNFYGTTYDGGSNYAGTVFRVTTNGTAAAQTFLPPP